MQEIGQQFEEELQELLDRYKDKMSTPAIMKIAQPVFHNTLSFAKHPERFPFATEKDYLAKFIAEGPNKGYAWTCVDEFNEGDWVVSDKEPL